MKKMMPQKIVCVLFLVLFLCFNVFALENSVRIYAQDWAGVGDRAIIWNRDGSVVFNSIFQLSDNYVIWPRNYDVQVYSGESLVYQSNSNSRPNFVLEILDLNKNFVETLSIPATLDEYIQIYNFTSRGYVRFPQGVHAWEYNQLFISNLNEDNLPPSLISLNPPSGVILEYMEDDLEVFFNFEDETSINYFVNDSSFSISSSGVLINNSILDVGNYCVLVEAKDSNYNSAFVEYCFSVVDTMPPIIESIEDVYLFEGNFFEKQINAFDYSGVFAYLVNDSSFSISSSGVLINNSILDVGNYSLEIGVGDFFDNFATASFNLFILSNSSVIPGGNETNDTLDLIPPFLDVLSPISNFVYNFSPVSILANVSDDNLDSVWFFDGVSNLSILPNNSYNYSLSNGNYTFTFYANDTSGNLASEIVSFVVNVTNGSVIPGGNDTLVVKCKNCDSKKGSSTVFQRQTTLEDLEFLDLSFDSGEMDSGVINLNQDLKEEFFIDEKADFSYLGILFFCFLFILLMMLLVILRILKR